MNSGKTQHMEYPVLTTVLFSCSTGNGITEFKQFVFKRGEESQEDTRHSPVLFYTLIAVLILLPCL